LKRNGRGCQERKTRGSRANRRTDGEEASQMVSYDSWTERL
jgi:hypothetical protein